MKDHGTNARYASGCKCGACLKAHSISAMRYRAKKKRNNAAEYKHSRFGVSNEKPSTVDRLVELASKTRVAA